MEKVPAGRSGGAAGASVVSLRSPSPRVRRAVARCFGMSAQEASRLGVGHLVLPSREAVCPEKVLDFRTAIFIGFVLTSTSDITPRIYFTKRLILRYQKSCGSDFVCLGLVSELPCQVG